MNQSMRDSRPALARKGRFTPPVSDQALRWARSAKKPTPVQPVPHQGAREIARRLRQQARR